MTKHLLANWQAPANVCALSTCRKDSGKIVFDKNNLQHRNALVQDIPLPASPVWLNQIHSNDCVIIEQTDNRKADAAITRSAKVVLAILTADCLPVVLTNTEGTEIAAIHAGWRGLCDGIVENTVRQMQTDPASLIAWIGPSICADCYEIGQDVFEAFHEKYAFASEFFHPFKKEKWLADLGGMARHILHQLKIPSVFLSNACTFEQQDRYYSWRRDGQTGRIATLVWFR